MDKAPADALVGRTVAHYEIVARLGGGGMGLVYAARDTRLGRRVALKFLPPQWSHDESAKERFIREAQAASATDHPNICTIHDVGTADDGQLFIVMAQYEGETIKQRLERGALPVDEAIDIAAQVAEGLAKAHAQGVVHRDIKPGNLMLTPDGVKILDFGLAKFADARFKLTLEGSTVGTIAYMSPEQTRGEEADARSDVWALGAVLYEMLAGGAAFKGGYPEAIAHAIKHEPPAPLRAARPDVSEALEQAVFRALHKDPAVRFQTARDLARALRRLQGRTLPLDLRTQMVAVPAEHPRLRARRMSLGIVAAAVAAAAIGGVWLAAPGIGSLIPGLRDEPPLPSNKNVAVLPFQITDGTPQDEAWATGISAMLAATLASLTESTLQVAPLAEAQPGQGQVDISTARTDLGATLIFTGTIERSGSTLDVAARLVDAASSRLLRTEHFGVPASDPAAFGDRLLTAALEMLDVDVALSEREAWWPRDTAFANASRLYVQGQGYLQYDAGYLQYYDKPENIDAAIDAFSEALALDPEYARAYAGLGEAYWRKQEITRDAQWADLAVDNCTRALVLDPGLAAGHLCLGRIHYGRGRYEEATVEFGRALEIESASDDAYAGLARAEAALGRYVQAEATYRRAITVRPRHWVNYNRLGAFYLSRGRYADAVEMFAQVVALAPEGFRGYSNLGAAYIQLGRYDEAIASLERSVAIHPTAASSSNLGTAYFNLGRFSEAARAFEGAVKLAEANYEIWGNLADAYFWAPGERPRAGDAYKRAIALAAPQLKVNPRNAKLVARLALYHAMVDERREATELVSQALQLAPADGEVVFWAAVAANRLGQTERALDLLEKARAAGFSTTVIRDTPDLGNLWRYPRFQNLLRGQ